MCTDPGKIEIDQRIIPVQCRKCDECKAHRKRNLLGMVLAEQKGAKATWFGTLTYGGGYDNEKAYILDYRDVKLYIKKMRKAGHRFKYLVVGEYGENGERAHWHILMMWQTEPPAYELGQRIHVDEWDKGFVQYEIPRSSSGTAAYCMKYMGKSNDGLKDIRKSTKMGHEYLIEYARKHARAGLALFARGNIYTIEGGANNRQGKPFYYPVEKTAGIYEKMLNAWLTEWANCRPDQKLAMSDCVREWLEEITQDMDVTAVQHEYLNRHYGYHRHDGPPPKVRETVYSLDGAVLRAHWAGYTLEYYDPEEGRVWHLNLSDVEHLAHPVRDDTGVLHPDVTTKARQVLETIKDRHQVLLKRARFIDQLRTEPLTRSRNVNLDRPGTGGTQQTHPRS